MNSQILLLEQSLKFEQERTQDLQQRLNEAKNQIQTKETHILELLQTIKDLSQGIKRLDAPEKRKKFF